MPEKITVVYINLYTEMGGGEHSLYCMLKEIDKEEVHPLMMFNASGPFVEKVEALGISTVIMPYPTVMLRKLIYPPVLIDTMRASRKLHRWFRTNKVDIIHCSDVLTLLLVAFPVMLLRIPVIYSVIFFYEWSRMLLFNFIALFLVKTIITNSGAVQGDLGRRTLFLKKRVSTIYPGIDRKAFRPRREGEVNTLKKELGLADDLRLIGMVARFEPAKGHNVFLQAASMLLRKRSDVRFVIVGGLMNDDIIPSLKRYRDEVMRLAVPLHDNVTFLDHRDDMPEIMRSLDVLVCPSVNEGFGLVVLEAVASGVPVVASKTVGALEAVKGVEAVYGAECGDASSLEEQIMEALNRKPVSTLSSAASATLERLTWRAHAENIEHTYSSLLETTM